MGKACQLSAVEQQKIAQWIAAHGTPQQVGLRCRIVSAAAAGESDVAIAQQLSVNRNTVILWRKRLRTKDSTVCGTLLPAADASPGIPSIRSPPSWMPPCKPNRRG